MIDRLSLCNEVLAPWGFAEQCAYASRLGYRGLEVAPYTLVDDPLAITGPESGPVFQVAFVADFAVTSNGLTGGNYRRNLVEMGGVSGDLGLSGDAASALAGTPIWVDGQLRAHIDDSGRLPGATRLAVEPIRP